MSFILLSSPDFSVVLILLFRTPRLNQLLFDFPKIPKAVIETSFKRAELDRTYAPTFRYLANLWTANKIPGILEKNRVESRSARAVPESPALEEERNWLIRRTPRPQLGSFFPRPLS